jgi:hypothetical protein
MNAQLKSKCAMETIHDEEDRKIVHRRVTKEMLDAYMEKHPYMYQEKPEEYADLTDEQWRENDEWADRAAKMMILSGLKYKV